MTPFDPHAYGPVFEPLLAIDRRRGLGAGAPDRGSRAALGRLSVESAFGSKAVDRDMAACCISGVWLLHDFLDESHTISQGIDSPSGSFWHAIMHRREGDYSNAKYWLRRVGQHPVFDALGQKAAELAAARGAERAATRLLTKGTWDAMAFVDLCESAARGKSAEADVCVDIQQAEWELLFNHCYAGASSS